MEGQNTSGKDYAFPERIPEILKNLDSKEFPQLVRILEALEDSSPEEWDDFLILAEDLMEADRGKDLPEEVISLCTGLYQAKIDEGDADAMTTLGGLYYEGRRGFEQNFEKAVALYKRAADLGERQAQENLGYCYYYGRDMEPDYEKAFHAFALGAFDGHLVSLYKIGDMYLNGYYVEKNPQEAYRIYNHCLSLMEGDEDAAAYAAGPIFLRLGDLSLTGNGTEQDSMAALLCYQRAEYYLYNMVKRGDFMYKRSLQRAIEGQEKARLRLEEDLPNKQWLHDPD